MIVPVVVQRVEAARAAGEREGGREHRARVQAGDRGRVVLVVGEELARVAGRRTHLVRLDDDLELAVTVQVGEGRRVDALGPERPARAARAVRVRIASVAVPTASRADRVARAGLARIALQLDGPPGEERPEPVPGVDVLV